MARIKEPLICLALGMACISGHSQGMLNFANAGPWGAAKIYDTDGVTGLLGTNFSADVYWAPGVTSDSCALQPLNEPAFFSSAPSQAGLFFGGPRSIPAAPGAVITAQVRVWPTAFGACGSQIGASVLFQVTLAPPPSAANMTELNGHPFALMAQVLAPSPWKIQDAGVRDNQIVFRLVPSYGLLSIPSTLVVETTSNLNNPVWSNVQTYNCVACPVCFSDPLPANASAKFYRVVHGF